MKKITTALLLLSAFVSNAQNETSLLNNYNYRTKGYFGVDVLGGINGESKNESSSVTNDKNNGFDVEFNPKIFGQYVTDKEQLGYTIGLQSVFSFNKNNIGSNKIKDNNIAFYLPLGIHYKHFYKKEYFWGMDLSTNNSYHSYKHTDTNNSFSGTDFYNYVTPTISIGKGRLNNINPMEKVLWILRDLKSENLLQSDLSENEITDFANAIVEIENTRMFDYRKKNKFALNLLLDKIKNHVNEDDLAKALNVIQDNYYFALIRNRNRGEQIHLQAGINNTYQQNNSKYVQEYFNNSNNFTPQVSLHYNKYKPLSLKKQIEYGASTGIGKSFWNNKNKTIFNDSTSTETKLKGDNIQFMALAYFQYGYYFSTRSNLQSGINLRYDSRSNVEKYLNSSAYLNYNYMINYRMRLFGSVSANLLNNEPASNRRSRLDAYLNLYYNLR